MNGKLQYPTVELEDMVSINHKPKSTNKLTDNYGNRYSRAIRNYPDYRKLRYLLNMKYSRFKATMYVPKGVSADGYAYLQIIADGKTIYTSPEMSKASEPIDIDVNVTGYNDVQINFSHFAYDNECIVCLGDAGFYQ